MEIKKYNLLMVIKLELCIWDCQPEAQKATEFIDDTSSNYKLWFKILNGNSIVQLMHVGTTNFLILVFLILKRKKKNRKGPTATSHKKN